MELRARSALLDGWQGSAQLAVHLDAAPDGSLVLLLDGSDPVKPAEAEMFELEIVAASAEERGALAAAGYQLPG